jgi:chromosome segregation ATPase
MKPKTIALTAAAAVLVTLTWTSWRTVRKWEAAYYQALAGKTQVVQEARADQAAMKARHDAAIAAKQQVADANAAKVVVAEAAAKSIRIRTAAEVAALRAASIPLAEQVRTLGDEVDARGLRITALDEVIARQREQIDGLDGLVTTTAAALDEQRQQNAGVIAELQNTIAKALKIEAQNRRRFAVYVGAGPSVAPDGVLRWSVQAGVGFALVRF